MNELLLTSIIVWVSMFGYGILLAFLHEYKKNYIANILLIFWVMAVLIQIAIDTPVVYFSIITTVESLFIIISSIVISIIGYWMGTIMARYTKEHRHDIQNL